MSDRDALLNAILEAPDDDAPRLIMADWLDDHNEPERAEFIRLQIYMPDGWEKRSNELRIENESKWLQGWPLERGWCIFGDFGGERVAQEINSRRTNWKWAKGFVSAITCTAANAITHLDAILAAQPVQEVTLTTWPEVERDWLNVDNPRYRFRSRTKEHDFVTISEESAMAMSRGPSIEEMLAAEWPRIKKWNLPLETPEFPNSADTLARRAQPHPMFPLRGSVRRV